MKCIATTKKGIQCTRNKTVGEHCTQHANINTETKNVEIKNEIITEPALIFDLQQIVNNYITPYDYHKLITKDSKLYTIAEYQKLQSEFENLIASELIIKLESESKILLNSFKLELKENKDEIKRLKLMKTTSQDISSYGNRNKQRYEFLKSYQLKLREFTLRYLEKIIQDFRDANIINITDLIDVRDSPNENNTGDLSNSNIIQGYQLSKFSDIQTKDKLRIEYNDVNTPHLRILKLLKSGYKEVKVIYDIENLSPLWKAYIKIIETENNIWDKVIALVGFNVPANYYHYSG